MKEIIFKSGDIIKASPEPNREDGNIPSFAWFDCLTTNKPEIIDTGTIGLVLREDKTYWYIVLIGDRKFRIMFCDLDKING